MVTQVRYEDLGEIHSNQRHQPLAFLQVIIWTPTQVVHPIKEAFEIMVTVEHMHWIMSSMDGVDLFMDYHNFIHVFDTFSVDTGLSQTSLRELLR